MNNFYLVRGREVIIEAPGKLNRIKNALIWDLNSMLSSRFDLYSVILNKETLRCSDAVGMHAFSKITVEFLKLDKMYIEPSFPDADDLMYYRRVMDPMERIDDDSFREMCCIENSDIEYIAINPLNEVVHSNLSFKSMKRCRHWITTELPVYVSLFGSGEMRIIVNQRDVMESVIETISKHCEKTQGINTRGRLVRK